MLNNITIAVTKEVYFSCNYLLYWKRAYKIHLRKDQTKYVVQKQLEIFKRKMKEKSAYYFQLGLLK